MAGDRPRVRLRQAVLAAAELEPVAEALRSTLGLSEPFRDPGVGLFGLQNTVFALGDCFLEIVSPTQPDTAAGPGLRLLVSRRFSWRSGGPVQRYIHQKLLREFIASHFVGPHDEFIFHGGEVSDAALGELKQVLRNTARQCAEIIERDRVPRENRHGAAFVLALRPWKYSGFNQFEREAGV